MAKAKFESITPEEERELIASSEEDGWVSVGDIEEQRRFWQEVARNSLKARAAEQGIPYQTLINSILHK